MSLFVEVDSIAPKKCKLIINLDYILEVAPLITGGCVLTLGAQEAGTSRTITVSDDYSAFKQFVMQTVTAESIQKRFPKPAPAPAPDPNRYPKQSSNIKAQGDNGVELDIPTFGGVK